MGDAGNQSFTIPVLIILIVVVARKDLGWSAQGVQQQPPAPIQTASAVDW